MFATANPDEASRVLSRRCCKSFVDTHVEGYNPAADDCGFAPDETIFVVTGRDPVTGENLYYNFTSHCFERLA